MKTTLESTGETAAVSVSELLEVRVMEGSDGVTYYSRVNDIVGEKLVIAWPTHRGMRLILHPDEPLDFYLVRNEVPHKFTGLVHKMNSSPVPQITIITNSAITRVQRRQNFRIKCLLPVEVDGTVQFARDDSPTHLAFRTVTCDLSASGMVIRYQKMIPEDSLVEIKLQLPDGGPAIRIPCRAVYSETRGESPSLYRTGLLFLAINESERARIVRFIYRTQLKGIRD